MDAKDELGKCSALLFVVESRRAHRCTAAPSRPTGRTPFLVAAAHGRDAILRALVGVFSVDGRVAAERQDLDGNNAVMLAARGGHAGALELLLSYGANRATLNSEHATAAHLIAEAPDADRAVACLRLLTAARPPATLETLSGRNSQGRNAAHTAAHARAIPLLREVTGALGTALLIEEDNHGETPLDVLSRIAALPAPGVLGVAAGSASATPGPESERLVALLDELEKKLTPAEARVHARRRARDLHGSGSAASARTATEPRGGAAAVTAAEPLAGASSAPVVSGLPGDAAVVAVTGGAASAAFKLPASVDLWHDDAVAEDDAYEYTEDTPAAAAAPGGAADAAALGMELRRRASGEEAAASLLPPPPPPGPPVFGTHRSSSMGIDESALPSGVLLPPDALGLSRQRCVGRPCASVSLHSALAPRVFPPSLLLPPSSLPGASRRTTRTSSHPSRPR